MGKYLLIFFLCFLVLFEISAQTNSEYDELKDAFENIENKNYKEACPYFLKMLRQYPKDPTYQYYTGLCLLNLEKDPNQAIPYLRYASSKNITVDVYYYLGIAYLRNYQFERAVKSFDWFEKNADRKRLKNTDYQIYKSMAQNGLYLTKYIQKPTVYSKNKYAEKEFYRNYTLDNLEGYFTDAYDYFNLQKDSLDDNSILFVPDDGRERYFAKRNDKRGDYDIYKITQLSDTSWSEPENLGEVINTPFDENYPFLHFDGSTLYFASKGHYSMGGYDLYKSTWNWSEQKWTEPENLDFPVNSPYDDVLFVASPNKRSAMFASNREKEPNRLDVYHIKLTTSEPYVEIKDHNEILEYARLKVNASIENEGEPESKLKYQTDQKDLIKIKNDEDFLYKTRYDSLLNLAISYQLKADSLRWIIDEKRSIFDVTGDGQERAQLSNVIVELEREIYGLQRNADNCYAQVREIEQLNLASKKVIYEEVKKEEEIEETKDEENNFYYEPIPDSISIKKLVLVEDTVEEDSLNFLDFGLRIENPSIYNAQNPIPFNESLPDGVIYMVQLGAFSSEKAPSIFKGLTPLSAIKKEDSKIRKYFAGKFFQLKEAEKNMGLIKSKGFRDSYIVAFNDGEIIPVKNAVKIESDREIPIPDENLGKEVSDSVKDQPKIIFVLKGQINLQDSTMIDSIRYSLTENLEFYIEDKNEISKFLIRSFTSYDEAIFIKNKLDPMLPVKVEIHAYFDENQIPLEQARKITQ